MKVKAVGMELFYGESGDRPFKILAHGAVAVGGLTIYGIALAWSESEGFTALAPSGRLATGAYVLRWDHRGKLAVSIAEALVAMYRKIGGEIPAAKEPSRIFIPLSELDLGGTPEDMPLRERVRIALDDESRCRGAECFTEVWERPSTVTEVLGDERDMDDKALAYDEAVAAHAETRNAEHPAAGLLRTLGCPVDETLERAGI